jgi:hypothetical protein
LQGSREIIWSEAGFRVWREDTSICSTASKILPRIGLAAQHCSVQSDSPFCGEFCEYERILLFAF